MIALLCIADNCNRTYKMARALRMQGLEVKAIKNKWHPYLYPNQIDVKGLHRLIATASLADVVWLTMGEPQLIDMMRAINKPLIVTYSGTKYRQNSEVINAKLNKIPHARIIQLGADLMKLGPKDAKFFSCRIIEDDVIKPKYNRNTIPVIGHFPSNPDKKGTEKINKIIERLKGHGYEFEYRTQNSPVRHDLVIHKMQQCDIYIDQLFEKQGDKPMGEAGNQSYEAAACGCVVITNMADTSYYESVHGPIGFELANNEEELYYKIVELITLPQNKLIDKCKESRKWVVKTHGLEAMGKGLKHIIDGCLLPAGHR